MSTSGNYFGNQPNNTAYVKQFDVATPDPLWKSVVYRLLGLVPFRALTPASPKTPSVYVPGNLFVGGFLWFAWPPFGGSSGDALPPQTRPDEALAAAIIDTATVYNSAEREGHLTVALVPETVAAAGQPGLLGPVPPLPGAQVIVGDAGEDQIGVSASDMIALLCLKCQQLERRLAALEHA